MDGVQRAGVQAGLEDVRVGTGGRLPQVITACGVVVHGAQRGRLLGFPTANVETTRLGLPAEGVYAGWYERPDQSQWACAVNVGRRPTFYEDAGATVEAHLIDFDGDLYGETAIVRLAWYLRAERAFSGRDALVAQLRADVAMARHLAGSAPDLVAPSPRGWGARR